jgi:hypothetical protein
MVTLKQKLEILQSTTVCKLRGAIESITVGRFRLRVKFCQSPQMPATNKFTRVAFTRCEWVKWVPNRQRQQHKTAAKRRFHVVGLRGELRHITTLDHNWVVR